MESVRDSSGGRLRNAILIAGPTASGKSGLALEVAERLGGAIVNTDSMQGYSVMNVLTARPSAADMTRVPHHLYGHIHPSVAYSTGAWLRDVMRIAADGTLEGKVPVFVGGTGLYFRALVEGIAEMPEIPAHTRERWRYRLLEEGSHALHRILGAEDPAAAAMLRPTDGQRIVRALEVLESSGRSILVWQAEKGRPLIDRASARCFLIEPERPDLVRRINERFDRMLEGGAMDEVRAMTALDLDPALPSAKALGLRELQAAEAGLMPVADAIERAKIATRQYAKRQMTWFRHQLDEQWKRGSPAQGKTDRAVDQIIGAQPGDETLQSTS